MIYKNSFLSVFIVISLTATILTSCADTEEALSEDHSKVGMRLIGEASEAETSLSGDSVQTQATAENLTSTTLSIPITTTTTTVESIPPPKTTRPSTTTTTLIVETPDKPFYAARATSEMLEVFKKQTDSEPKWLLSNPGPFEGDRVLLIRKIEEDWVQVLMPIRPHGTLAWVPRDSVSITEHKAKVIVDKYSGVLEGWQDGELLFRESFISGSDKHPTPLGDFYINEINLGEDGMSEDTLVGITAFSKSIEPTAEGDPAIAFLVKESNEGSDESTTRGCIRVSTEVLELLTRLPLGTPVQIVG